jgi:transposase
MEDRWIYLEDYEEEEEEKLTQAFLSKIENVLLNGTQLILDQVYKRIGFDRVNDNILKKPVISRLSQLLSKSATVDYLQSYYEDDVNLSKIYRYLDLRYNTQKDLVQKISVEHTRKVLRRHIGVVVYDVTTLYFETDYEDDIRGKGFSKDGKHSQPQIVLGLLVSAGGYPLSYSLFNGSQYEG